MTDEHLPSPPADGTDHPGAPELSELSELVDGLLAPEDAAAVNAHVDTCPDCAHQLTLLRSARETLSEQDPPMPPAGSMDIAVTAALASVARVAREATRSAALPVTDSAASPALASPPSPRTRGAVTRAARRTARVTAGADATALSFDAGAVSRRAARNHRHLQFATRAAAAVLILGGLGGIGYAVAHSVAKPSNATSAGTVPLNGLSPQSSTTRPLATPLAPPAGTFVLQLRREGGRDSCSKVGHHLANLKGTLVNVDPPATGAAVVALPRIAGQPATCVSVGLAFVIAWSGDVTKVTMAAAPGTASSTATGAGAVDVTIRLGASAVSDMTQFDSAVAGHFTVAVIARGAELGTALVRAGPVLELQLSKSVGTSVVQQLSSPPG